MKTVKSVITRLLDITLFERPDGRYEVEYLTADGPTRTQPITDYNTATFIFDKKVELAENSEH